MSFESVLAWLGQLPGQAAIVGAGILAYLDPASFDLAVLRRVIGTLLLPPALPLLVAAVGLLCLGRWPRLGRSLAWFGVVAAFLFSTGFGASLVAALAEGDSPRGHTVDSLRRAMAGPDAPQAIVVIGGGAYSEEREGPNREIVRPLTLERLAHAAWVARVTRLPVLVSGGPPREGMSSEAALMKRALEESFGTPVRWVEDSSRDTAENAKRSAEILRRAGIGRVILVTQAYHMPRAQASFRNAGLTVLPAPHGFAGAPTEFELRDLLPSGGAAALSYRASHELLGRLWYGLRGDWKR